MAFNSRQCVSCKDPTKRNDGKYYGKDEKGSFSGPMYSCDNESCNIYYERKRLLRQTATLEAAKKPYRTK